MSLDADLIVDRRRMRRKLSFWRVATIALIVIGIAGAAAASGGYITALASDHIVAQQTSLVGSIGVLFQYPNFADLLGKIGVKVESVKSTPLKAAPDGFEPTSPEAKAALDSIIQDSYSWFKTLVRDR